MPEPTIRPATISDIPALKELIAASARELARDDYSSEQIEAALGSAWGVDTQLIHDGTYFAVERPGDGIVACGGWSYRRTLFGSDAQTGREAAVLDPETEAARIRAFFVRPDWARRGVGKALLEKCEAEARRHGFKSATLVATLPGQRLYRKLGYIGETRTEYPLANGLSISFVPMTKVFV
jgi:N-acetylglutamate synthase-like GNAT family acetyltransferase